MLQPKKTKYRKQQKGRVRGNATRGFTVSFGSFGLKALDTCFLTSKQLEAARVALNRFMKREGQVWIRVFPDKPMTRKPAEVRMGKGKGAPEFWVARCRPGTIIFEADGVPMRLASQKLPVITKFVVKPEYSE
jgi:large subunit ribosomal protein L16